MVDAVPFRADLLRIEGWDFGGEFMRLQIIIFSLGIRNPLTLTRPKKPCSSLANSFVM
jgi:hypothetical protein